MKADGVKARKKQEKVEEETCAQNAVWYRFPKSWAADRKLHDMRRISAKLEAS